MSAPVPVAVIIAAARKKYLTVFRKQQAVSPAQALTPESAGLKRTMIFRHLVRQGVIVATSANTFYLDEAREQEVQKLVKKRGLMVVSILIIVLLIIVAIAFAGEGA